MTASNTQPIDLLLSRASTADLQEPGPDQAATDAILEAALRAPDHGKLRPWRFIVIRGAARTAWAEIVVSALHAREPDAPAQAVEKQRHRALATPLILGLVARIQPSPKIPEFEQLLSVGAAGMNLLNAAHALGFGAVWLTGANAYDPAVLHRLGLAETEKLAGIMLVGSKKSEPHSPRPSLARFVTEWTGAPIPAPEPVS